MQRKLAVRLFQWRSREQRRSLRSIFRLFVQAMSIDDLVADFLFLKELDPENRKFVGAYTREKIAGMLSEMEKENN